jgi:hypothetical protein
MYTEIARGSQLNDRQVISVGAKQNLSLILQEKLVQEIIGCLSKSRALFYYYKDRYALMLLSYLVEAGRLVPEIKASRY